MTRVKQKSFEMVWGACSWMQDDKRDSHPMSWRQRIGGAPDSDVCSESEQALDPTFIPVIILIID